MSQQITAEPLPTKPSRLLTAAIILTIGVLGFDTLAIATIAPDVVERLQGRDAYSWIFSSFFLASILGAVVSGQESDRQGPHRSITWGLFIFGIGLLLSGFASSMTLLLAGRVLQGFGSGILMTSVYVVVYLAYDDADHSRMMAIMSSAWVAPALLGPLAASYIATYSSWRWVFLGLVPFVILVYLVFKPSLPKDLGEPVTVINRLPTAIKLIIGATLLLAAPSQPFAIVSVGMAVAGLLLGFTSLRPLLPSDTLKMGRGLPTAIVVRGLVFAAFSTVEAYLAIAITSVLGFSSLVAGLVIALAAVTWTAATWLQERMDVDMSAFKRKERALIGTLLLFTGISLQVAALYVTAYPLAVSLVGSVFAGLGVGLAHTATSVLVLQYAKKGEEGATTSGMYLFEQLAFSLAAGAGGALLSAAEHLQLGEREGVLFIFIMAVSLAGFSLLVSPRLTEARTVRLSARPKKDLL